jgi:hypothetical protein
VAVPRLPALFEEPGTADARAGLEVEEEIAAPRVTTQRGDDARPPSGVAAASHLGRDARGRAPELDEPAPLPVALPGFASGSAEAGPPPVEPVAAPVVARAEVASGAGPERAVSAPAAPPRHEPALPPRIPARQAAAPRRAAAVTAAPAARAREPGPPEEPSPVATRVEEPPTVQVRIGRLEVRANLHEARPDRPRREQPAAPPGLSLSDYLRGRREVG